MKKYGLMLFIFIIVFSCFSVCYAGTFKDLIDTKYEGIVESLHFLKIVDGVSANVFDANKVVTRAELSKMLVLAHGYYKYKDLLNASSSFKDVKSGTWYYDYVNIASAYGFVNGYPNGYFNPDKEVTYAEAVAMILRSLGHKYIKEDSEYGWEFNYIQRMRDLKLNEGMAVFANSDKAKRGEVAILIWNMLLSTPWEEFKEDGIGQITYTDTGEALLDRVFEEEYQLVIGKQIRSFSAVDGKMFASVDSFGTVELVTVLPIYAIGSKMTGVYNKNTKELVVVTYDMDCAIEEGYTDDLKDEGYKINRVKNQYYFGGKNSEYTFLAIRREDGEEIIERAINLDLTAKRTIEKIDKKDGIYTINETYEINSKKAILLDGKSILDWSKLSKDDQILTIVNNEIYLLANKYKSKNEKKKEKKLENIDDNLYYITSIEYDASNVSHIGISNGYERRNVKFNDKTDSFEIGNFVAITVDENDNVKISKASASEFKKLESGRELILNYSTKDYIKGALGKYTIDSDTKIFSVQKKYQNNSSNYIEKCLIEETDETILRYLDKEVVNIIAKGNKAKTIYIEYFTNKFDLFYARVREVIVEKDKIKLSILPVDHYIETYETKGRVDCEVGDLISYTLSDKNVLKIVEVYRKGIIGYEGDFVVKSTKGKEVTLTNGEKFNQTDLVIHLGNKDYKISDYIIIISKLRQDEDGWKFSANTFGEMKSISFNPGDRIAIDELEDVIVIYTNYNELLETNKY